MGVFEPNARARRNGRGRKQSTIGRGGTRRGDSRTPQWEEVQSKVVAPTHCCFIDFIWSVSFSFSSFLLCSSSSESSNLLVRDGLEFLGHLAHLLARGAARGGRQSKTGEGRVVADRRGKGTILAHMRPPIAYTVQAQFHAREHATRWKPCRRAVSCALSYPRHYSGNAVRTHASATHCNANAMRCYIVRWSAARGAHIRVGILVEGVAVGPHALHVRSELVQVGIVVRVSALLHRTHVNGVFRSW